MTPRRPIDPALVAHLSVLRLVASTLAGEIARLARATAAGDGAPTHLDLLPLRKEARHVRRLLDGYLAVVGGRRRG